jgi:hypothetical protein
MPLTDNNLTVMEIKKAAKKLRVPTVDHYKYLGVIVDSDLSAEKSIQRVNKIT